MTFIIAEIGINHNGSLQLAKELIAAAKWCGADAVKFQKRTIEIVYAGQLDKPRESPWGNTNGDQKNGLELSRQDYDAINDYCRDIRMGWFASAWDVPSIDFLKPYDLPYNKIASAMATNMDFVKAVGIEKKPTFLSTGMCEINEIEMAAWCLQELGSNVTLMHTVSTYPANETDLNLRCIPMLKEKFGLPVGYSGHETSVSPSIVAVVMGAAVVERHITLDRSMYGSDQAASLEPIGFKTMVDQIRKVPKILGDGIKKILPAEMEIAKKLRYWE